MSRPNGKNLAGARSRIHRPIGWFPARLALETNTPDKERSEFDWNWSTLMPKVGIPYGLEYTFTMGTAELADYTWFFFPFNAKLDPRVVGRLDIKADSPVVYYPRRVFDLGTRVISFCRPACDCMIPHQLASLLVRTRQIYPDPAALSGPEGNKRKEDWARREDSWSAQ